jgi:preprotein translocase subunit YajC
VASLILIVAMFALLWVLLIRPQRQRTANQQRLIDSIEPGDEILTVGGIYGIVEEIDEEDDLVVEIAEGIQVRVSRRAVAAVVKPEDDEEDEEDEEPDEEADDGAETESEEAFDEPDGVGAVNDREDEVRDEAPADPTAAPRS